MPSGRFKACVCKERRASYVFVHMYNYIYIASFLYKVMYIEITGLGSPTI